MRRALAGTAHLANPALWPEPGTSEVHALYADGALTSALDSYVERTVRRDAS